MVKIKKSYLTNWIIGAALLLTGLFVIIALVMTQSQAETTTVAIVQSAPTIDLVKLCADGSATGGCTALTTYTGGTTGVGSNPFFVRVTDQNGFGDISTVGISVFRSGVGFAGCSSSASGDANDCYSNYEGGGFGMSACTQNFQIDSVTAWWKCNGLIQYYADATDASSNFSAENWLMEAIAYDSTGGAGNGSGNFELATVLSMDFGSSTIDYGTLSLGQTATGLAVLGTTQGNSDVDMTIQAADTSMTCDGTGSADMAVSVQKFGTDNTIYASLASNLSTTAQHLDFETGSANNEMKARTDPNNPDTDSVYFGIQIPSTGISGTCTVAATLVAVNE